MVENILDRLDRELPRPYKVDRLSFEMDLAAVHYHTELDLEAFLQADTADFLHDAYGIMRHMDRHTGRLQHGFRPRFIKKVQA